MQQDTVVEEVKSDDGKEKKQRRRLFKLFG